MYEHHTPPRWTQLFMRHTRPSAIVVNLRLVIFHHGGGDIGSGNHMLLVLDGSLDDLGVIDVRDQTDNQIMLSDEVSNSLVAVDVAFDSLGAREFGRQGLGILQSTAGYFGSISLGPLLES